MNNTLRGQRIREARLKKGLSLRGLSKPLAVSFQAISHWEQGLHTPNVRYFPVLAEVLDIPVISLVVE